MPEFSDRTKSKDLKSDGAKVKPSDPKALVKQVNEEYELAIHDVETWAKKKAEDLFLLNNKKKDPKSIGDNLLFTIHQSVLAALYSDQMLVDFLPNEEGDIVKATNLNGLAEFDYGLMKKDVLDYFWDWDALFFNRGYVMTMEYDYKNKVIVPELIDPMTVVKDPYCFSVRGDQAGRGAARYFYYSFRATKRELENHPAFFDIDGLQNQGRKDNLLNIASDSRRQAQGREILNKNLTSDNEFFDLVGGFTWFDNSLWYIVLGNERQHLVRAHKLSRQSIPINERSIFPVGHGHEGLDIVDLVGDKQKAKARILNTAVQGIEQNQFPMHLFNQNKIRNKADLAKYRLNKYIPVNGDPNNVVAEIRKSQVKQEVQWILDFLDQSSQKATATPEMQQGMLAKSERSATELGLVQQGVDARYSLAAKVFGWSEREFWYEWYRGYAEYFSSGVERKSVRVNGYDGYAFRQFSKNDIVMGTDPDIKIQSETIS